MDSRMWMDSSKRVRRRVVREGRAVRVVQEDGLAEAAVRADSAEAGAVAVLAAVVSAVEGAVPAAPSEREMGSVETALILGIARIEGGRVSTARLHLV